MVLVASKRTIGDSSADENHRDILSASLAQKVWPYFRLQHYDQGWTHRAYYPANTKCPIQREIKDCIGELQTFPSECLAGDGRSGDHQWAIWICLFQAFCKGNAGKKLTYRYRVNPDGTRVICRQFVESFGRQAEPLTQVGQIFS